MIKQVIRRASGRDRVLVSARNTTAIILLSVLFPALAPVRAAEVTFAEPVISTQTLDGFREETGVLPDGTRYLIRMPDNWNGIFIRDLDYADRVSQETRRARYDYLLENGYAVGGTARHHLRAWQYDPAREISNLDFVLDRFEAEFGDPEYVIQYGCSGGGHVSLAVAEDFHDRIDGAVALSAHNPIWLMNTFLDGWYVLQTFLGEYYEDAGHGPASNLIIIGLPNDGTANQSGHGMVGDLPEAWRLAFEAANASAEGRARMALAFAVSQWPVWMADDTERPAYTDLEALQESIYQSLLRLAGSPGGEARIMFENAAQGQQLSWNDNVNYAEFFANANGELKAAVETLYQNAGLDLEGDLETLNDATTVQASRHALDYWGAAGRSTVGSPQIPVMRVHTLGDYQIPYTLMLGYEQAARENGSDELLRTALVEATGHCVETALSTAESAAALEVLVRRLKQGEWPDTDPETLNQIARDLDNSPARFIDVGEHAIGVYNRRWIRPEIGSTP